MPEEDSARSLELGKLVASTLGVASLTESITPILVAAGCYRRRDEAIRNVIPAYEEGWKSKLVVGGSSPYSFFTIVTESPEGVRHSARLSLQAYHGVVSATNFKQRTRKMLESIMPTVSTTRCRHTEPAGVRSRFLCEGWRRCGRFEARSPPLQMPGISTRRMVGSSRGDPPSPSQPTLWPAADAGRILLFCAPPKDGFVLVRKGSRNFPR